MKKKKMTKAERKAEVAAAREYLAACKVHLPLEFLRMWDVFTPRDSVLVLLASAPGRVADLTDALQLPTDVVAGAIGTLLVEGTIRHVEPDRYEWVRPAGPAGTDKQVLAWRELVRDMEPA